MANPYLIEPKWSDGVSFDMQQACGEWYDGGNSAMYRFYANKPYDCRKLVKEINELLNVPLSEKNTHWTPKLEAVRDYAKAEVLRVRSQINAVKAIYAAIETGGSSLPLTEAIEAARVAAAKRERDAA